MQYIQNKSVRWSCLKNNWLKKTRGIAFEEIIKAELLDIKKHPAKPEQKLLVFKYDNYIWVVPYIENNKFLFLKTMYKSRKYKKLYIGD